MPHVHLARRPTNPLKVDPTRTTILRKSFYADIKRRLTRLQKALDDFLLTKDALGLKEKKLGLSFNVFERQYAYLTDDAKLVVFNNWLQEQINAGLFSVPIGTPSSQLWTATYIQSAYRMGLLNAYFASKKQDLIQGDMFAASEEFLRSSFAQPELMSKVRLLATRAFEGMRGLGGQISSDLNFILADGMINGRGVEEIARMMRDKIDTMSSVRALRIARAEIINAHSEGSLDGYERLGVKELGVDVEFSATGDRLVCPVCAGLSGQVFTIEKARGVIPVHPNCRCAWIPAIRSKG